MATQTELIVNGIKIPEDAEQALIDAYREDINEMGDVALFAARMHLTINLYKPTAFPAGLEGSLEVGRKMTLLSEARAALSEAVQSFGNGIPLVNLFYNTRTKRYEILEITDRRFVRVGNAGDKNDPKDSLCRCMAYINKPSGSSAERSALATFYKSELTGMRNLSDENIRGILQQNVIPGINVENQLQQASLRREEVIKMLRKLVPHLREELDTVDPPQKESSKYSKQFQETRDLVEDLESVGGRKIEDFTYEQLVEKNVAVQKGRLQILKKGYKKTEDWLKEKVYEKKFINGDEDYKAVALAAVLDDTSLSINERFRLASSLINSVDPDNLKTFYMRVRGSTNVNQLEIDVKAKFYEEGEPTSPLRKLGGLSKYFTVGEGHKLQFPYLKSVLENGQHIPAAQLAMKLGLIYRGAEIRNLSREQKDEIIKLIEDNPGDLAGLANVTDDGNLVDTSNEFLQPAYDKLKKSHSAFLDELQVTLKHYVITRPITGIDVATIDAMDIENGAAKSLMRYLYDEDKKVRRIVGSSVIDTVPIKKRILKWIQDCSIEELTGFIKAGESTAASKPPTPYEELWNLIDRQLSRGLDAGDWKRYFLGMATARMDEGPEAELEYMKPFYEVEALLKYQKSRGFLLSRNERKATLAKVLNTLSATNEWDPRAKLVTFIRHNADTKKLKEHEEYTDDPVRWLDKLLKRGGVDLEGTEQVHAMLYAGGSYYGEEATDSSRNIDNYLSLKRKAHRKYFSDLAHGLSTENIVTAIVKVKSGSLEHWLMRKDKNLLWKIREELRDQYLYSVDSVKQNLMKTMWSAIYQRLDLNKKWEDLENRSPEKGYRIMPEPPSEDELEEFKKIYKDDVQKKKLWAGKYALAYSLGKDQSLFRISDRKELIKVVYEAQLEKYQGHELTEILDGISPKIRESLEKTPPAIWTNHEKAAHTLLRKFLIDNEEIALKDFLDVAKGLFSNDYAVIDFAVNDLSPEKAVTVWCSKSYNELKTWSEIRLQKTMQLHAINTPTTGAPSTESKSLIAEIRDLDEKIKKHTFEIDDELLTQLQHLTREVKAVEFERKLKQNIGEAMLSEPEKFEDIHISPFELSLKGTKLLAEANIHYRRYLRSGVGYHRFSTSGMESQAEGNKFMRELWKAAAAEPTGTAKQREFEEKELLLSVKRAHEDLLSSLDKWKGKQDEYTEQIVKLMGQAVGLALLVALSATVIGTTAALALVPIKAGLNIVVTKTVETALSREGDVLPQELIKDVLVSIAAAVPGVLATIDYGDVPGLKKIINNTIGNSLVKSQITAITKAVFSGIGNALVAGGSGDFEMSSKAFKENIMKTLQDYNVTRTQIYKTVLTGLSQGFSKAVSDGIKAGVAGADGIHMSAFDNLDKAMKDKITAKSKGYTLLYKMIYNRAMMIKGYDLLAEAPAALGRLAFPDQVVPDQNKLEEESEVLDISNALVEALAEKGLQVDKDFDYSDVDKLMNQIAEKMPGVRLTPEEKRVLAADVEKSYEQKVKDLTEDEKMLTEREKKKIIREKGEEELINEKKKPWLQKLEAMKASLKQEYKQAKVDAEEQAETNSKELVEAIQEVQNGLAVKEHVRESWLHGPFKGASPQDDDIDIVAESLAARLHGVKSKKKLESQRKRIRFQWRRRRWKKKVRLLKL